MIENHFGLSIGDGLADFVGPADNRAGIGDVEVAESELNSEWIAEIGGPGCTLLGSVI